MPKAIACLFLWAAAFASALANWSDATLLVSVPDQKIAIVEHGNPIATFPVSTSRFGLGDSPRSFATPLGELEIAQKIGEGAPMGAVFKARHWTGEILHPNAPGRDPIVTRILWLRGLEAQNRNAYERGIYIHGTTVERLIGRPASFGCIRMRSRDIVQLFERVSVGTHIVIANEPIYFALHRFAATSHRGKIAG